MHCFLKEAKEIYHQQNLNEEIIKDDMKDEKEEHGNNEVIVKKPVYCKS